MTKTVNLTGKRFGRLTAVRRDTSSNKTFLWVCQCDCGKEKIVRSYDLRDEKVKSCGCLHAEKVKTNTRTHGKSNTLIYKIWCSMKARCYRKTCKDFHDYGGRGIIMCDYWRNNFMSFYEWSMTNGYEEGLSIDRINNDGIYEPLNCRWVTQAKQARNKSNNRFITVDRITKTLADWCKFYKVHISTAHSRLKKGKTSKEIFIKNTCKKRRMK
ncbi:hypothetical protein ABE47_31500 [Bacillus thuringiensis]|uniref:hypothetical protein n=1 Tax=Bacillus thuringiensis TaxID=1428 RepID=UPI001A7E75AF|nr:hypothetical protein [Bacillus thuringiensis]MBG9504002.1 hypothetical protein [Bacillus thuringiensis]MBG9516477.1 hypothetical protein [Bacillus thuringiensis]